MSWSVSFVLWDSLSTTDDVNRCKPSVHTQMQIWCHTSWKTCSRCWPHDVMPNSIQHGCNILCRTFPCGTVWLGFKREMWSIGLVRWLRCCNNHGKVPLLATFTGTFTSVVQYHLRTMKVAHPTKEVAYSRNELHRADLVDARWKHVVYSYVVQFVHEAFITPSHGYQMHVHYAQSHSHILSPSLKNKLYYLAGLRVSSSYLGNRFSTTGSIPTKSTRSTLLASTLVRSTSHKITDLLESIKLHMDSVEQTHVQSQQLNIPAILYRTLTNFTRD